YCLFFLFFFFQAEDGIRDGHVTGVQTCALPIFVVNHHLFFADVMLKDEGMAELLPACNTVIFDEAHQLPETATLFFGESLSTGQIIELARDVRAEALTAAKDMPDPLRLSAALDKAARDLRLALPNEGARFTAASARGKREVSDALSALDSALRSVCAALDAHTERSAESSATLGVRVEGCAH